MSTRGSAVRCEVVATRLDLMDHLDKDWNVHMLNTAKHFQKVSHKMIDQCMHSVEQTFGSMKKMEADIKHMKSDMKSFKTHQAAECDHRNHYKTDLLKELVQKLVNETGLS